MDRTATYKARDLAIRYLKELNLKYCNIQLCYAIGKIEPLSIYINSDKGKIIIPKNLYNECSIKNMISDLNLLDTNYEELSRFGHFQNEFDFKKRV